MSQFVSTMIDDESLIEELRRYGEPNLPTLSQSINSGAVSASRRTRSSVVTNELNDSNREIYLKKLNHYRAKEKAKLNPSKQYKKQQQQAEISKALGKRSTRSNEDVVEIDDDNDEGSGSDYVRMNHASTSPMGNGTLSEFNNNDDWPQTQSTSNQTESRLEYIKLKERIELDKTLSKYRSEINNILATNNVRNRFHQSTASTIASVTGYDDTVNVESSNKDDKDVVYTKTVLRPRVSAVSSSSSRSPSTSTSLSVDDIVTQTHYCPKPVAARSSRTSSLIDSIKSAFVSRPQNPQTTTGSQTSYSSAFNPMNQLRNGVSSVTGNVNNQPLMHPSVDPRATYLTPKKETPGVFLSHVSHLSIQLAKTLPYLIGIIVVVIVLQYVRVRYQRELEANGGHWPSAQPPSSYSHAESSPSHQYCDDIKDPQCASTKILARELIDYLRYVAGRVDCSSLVAVTDGADVGDGDEVNQQRRVFIEKCVHINKMIDYLTRERGLIRFLYLQDEAINSVLRAVIKNPHWEIRLLNSTYANTEDLHQVTYLMSSVSYKPLTCRFKELVHFLYVRAVMLVCALLCLAVAYLAYTTWRNARTERERAFFHLIARVTEHVEKQFELSRLDAAHIKPYVPISHVYAAMFEASERALPKTAKLWQRVCKFIQDHESRIHVEAQFVDGEETLVWRWVAASTSSTKSPSKTTSAENGSVASATTHHDIVTSSSATSSLSQPTIAGWQGDAFDRSDRPLNSPTPCLKVRNMFDVNTINLDPNFNVKIHNDILEKCCGGGSDTSGSFPFRSINNTSILHIACDKRSKEGCVYIKCVSNEAAGKVYQALNGTWYNGKLLNVKFLRSDRYIERYPQSVNYNTFLQPLPN